MIYSAWLLGLSILFLVVERLRPRRAMPVLRREFWTDLAYCIFNGEYLALLVGIGSVHAIAVLDRTLDIVHLRNYLYLGAMSERPVWLQFIVLLFVLDFCQWAVHNALHRVPWLWEFHKVHHSIVDLDWIGNWRFHWVEAIVYKSVLYFPAAFFGFSVQAMFGYAVVNTFVGHFAHANLRIHIGPLKYLINSPEMHIWHHTHPESGPPDRNFALTLSLWDWLFRTAYLPNRRDPERLGFAEMENFPRVLWRQVLIPFLPTRRSEAN
jgi:sterol desaturase/sphingolipid hydroxylase (fatty acid hydroxylase superfamily)